MSTTATVTPTTAPRAGAADSGTLLPGRFAALDVFRGLTIAGMILVNTPGSWSYVYAPLRHAAWHGATPTDLVFPFFLFVTGCAMWFSFRKFGHRPSADVLRKIGRRVVLIFAIGLALRAFPFAIDYSEFRILGVLQRIALAYGVGALLCLYLSRRALAWTSAGVLVGYWVALWLGGGADPYGVETNLVRQVDLALLGADHLYRGFGLPFDPEGLLSTLPAAITVVSGYFVGQLLGTTSDRAAVVRRIIGWGIVGVVAGLAWHLVFPINKPLWTSSYVLYTSGLAAIGLAIVIWLVDLRGIARWGEPFKVYGMNPLFAYVLSVFWVLVLIRVLRFPGPDGSVTTGYQWLFTNVFEPLAGSMNGSLLFALTHVALFWGIVYVLYRKRIFIKI